jgi:hypothetical protein
LFAGEAVVHRLRADGGRAPLEVRVRRSTLAHELGHLLWDPNNRLQTLAVDLYDDLEQQAHLVRDPVEQRANAFSVQFIAPKESVLKTFDASGGAGGDGVRAVMDEFGISFTAARYQIWNAHDRLIPFETLRASSYRPTEEWEARETYAVSWHPLSSPSSRAGRFSGVVVRAAQESLISWDTAAMYLQSSADEVAAAAHAIREMYPAVFEGLGVASHAPPLSVRHDLSSP